MILNGINSNIGNYALQDIASRKLDKKNSATYNKVAVAHNLNKGKT